MEFLLSSPQPSIADKLPVSLLYSQDGIVVWQADVNAEFEPCLSDDEQQRADSIHHPHARQEFIVGRSLLRYLLGHYLNRMPGALHFGYGAHGKPMIQDGALEFSVSHSPMPVDCYCTTVPHWGRRGAHSPDERYI